MKPRSNQGRRQFQLHLLAFGNYYCIAKEIWKDEELKYCDSFSEIEPEEGDCARVLQFINEFLPVKEMAGRLIEVPVLRQFGLVENEQVDSFLATAFGKSEPTKSGRTLTPR